MVKKITILLTLTLLLVELYNLKLPWIGDVFPKGVSFCFYPFNPHKEQNLRWHVTFIVNLVLWVEAFVLWKMSLSLTERERWELKMFLPLMIIFRGMGLVAYLLNAAVASPWQLIVYTPMILYVLSIRFRVQYWQLLEWLYSKIKSDGRND